MTDFLTTLLQRFGYLLSKMIAGIVSAFFASSQYIATLLINIMTGFIAELMSRIPGVSSEEAFSVANQARHYLEEWNSIFPVYEALVCISLLFGFRIMIGMYRAVITIIWNASNLHNALPKFFGTG